MKKRILTYLLASILLIGILPIGASAEWRENNIGWWYSEGNSWATGWREINGKWYCFNDNGYMMYSTTVNGYQLGSDGAWIENSNTTTYNNTANNISNTSSNISSNTNSNSQSTKVYQAGEKWVVDGLWEFTINSVKVTDERNQFSDKDPAQVVYIDYSYTNLGYTSNYMDLYFGSPDFTVLDGNGEVANEYPVSDAAHPARETPVGAKCSGAKVAYGLENKSSEITIQIKQYVSGTSREEKATFKIPVQ